MRTASPGLARLRRHLAAWLLCLPLPLWALTADRNEPINIEADRATLDDRRGHSTYRGNVHLQQGTLHLHGDTMTVQMRDERIEKIVLTGKPATYVQQLDETGKEHHAEAGRIEYHASEERMILLDNARVWQPGNEEFKSDRIVYNLANKTINAGGDSSGDRVHITLQPHKSEAVPAAEPDATQDAAPSTAAEAAGAEPAP